MAPITLRWLLDYIRIVAPLATSEVCTITRTAKYVFHFRTPVAIVWNRLSVSITTLW